MLGAFQTLSCTWWWEKAVLATHQVSTWPDMGRKQQFVVQFMVIVVGTKTWTFYNFHSAAHEDTHKPSVVLVQARAIWITSKSTLAPGGWWRWQSKMTVLKFCNAEIFYDIFCGTHDLPFDFLIIETSTSIGFPQTYNAEDFATNEACRAMVRARRPQSLKVLASPVSNRATSDSEEGFVCN